jgi:transposase
VTETTWFAGLDVHARKTAAAAVQLGSGEVFKAQLPGSSAAAIEWLRSLPGEVRAVYEAGPTGFELARAARAAGVELMVCAPGAISRQPGDRVKTDTRDALKLARLHAAGQLRPVLVPAPELEALRDLVRAREDLRGDLMSARHRVSKLLLRQGLIWPGPGEAWAQRHLQWLSKIRFGQPLQGIVLGEYLAHHEVLLARRERLDVLILEQSLQGPWAPLVARLRCLRGIDTLSARSAWSPRSVRSLPSHTPSSWPAISAWSHPSSPRAPNANRDRSPKPAPAMPADCSSRPPGTTVVHPASRSRSSAARKISRPSRSRPRGVHRSACIAAGHTSTQHAPRNARPSPSRSHGSWRASSGDRPATQLSSPTSRSVWGWRPAPRHTGPALAL